MLRRIFVGLLTLQLSAGLLPASAAAFSDADHIRSLRASALESCARGDVDTGLTTFDSAIRLAERTFGKDSTYVADLCFDEGVVALKKDQYQRAEDCLVKAVTLTPNAPQARLKLAEVYKVRGRLNDAKHQIEKVLGRDPSNLQARALLALTYQKEGNVARATDEAYKLEQITSGQAAGDQFAITASPVAMAAPAPVAPVAPPTGAIGGFSRIPPPAPKPTPTPEPAPVAPTPAPTPAPAPAQVYKPVVPVHISSRHGKHEKLDRRALLEMKRHHDKHEKHDKHDKHDKKNAHPQHASAGSVTDSSWAVQTRQLNSKAKLLTPVPHAGKHRAGLVPPPPPVVPAFGGYAPPPPRAQMPQPQAAAPAPKPAAAAPKPSGPSLKAATPKVDPGDSGGGGDDNNEDWMLDWAGKNKKKKK